MIMCLSSSQLLLVRRVGGVTKKSICDAYGLLTVYYKKKTLLRCCLLVISEEQNLITFQDRPTKVLLSREIEIWREIEAVLTSAEVHPKG